MATITEKIMSNFNYYTSTKNEKSLEETIMGTIDLFCNKLGSDVLTADISEAVSAFGEHLSWSKYTKKTAAMSGKLEDYYLNKVKNISMSYSDLNENEVRRIA